MILAVLLLAALDAAQAAFTAGDYAQAESLALAERTPDAMYLAGLARFRQGRAKEALEALDAAGLRDLPLWHFNRAACLYQLGRFSEAEQEYERAAAEPALSAAALVEAGFAALDAGSPQQARALAEKARPAATGAAAESLADLDAHLKGDLSAEYREGLAAFDAGKYAEARAHFQSAAALDPQDGRSRVMSGASALRLGARDEARQDLSAGLSLELDPQDAQAARAYLSELKPRPEWHGRVKLGAGVDTDPFQTGLIEPNEFLPGSSTAQASAAFTAEAAIGWKFAGGAQLSYGFDQLAYAASSAQDRSLQQHALGLSYELSLKDDLRIGGSLSGQIAFAGLSTFSGLQAAGGAGGFLAYDETADATARLDLSFTRKQGLSGLAYLTGDRADAIVSQEFRLGGVTLGGGYSFRLEDIGDLAQPVPFPPPQQLCGPNPPCTQQSVEPYGYTAHIGWLSARSTLLDRLELELSAGYEWRDYLDDSSVLVSDSAGGTRTVNLLRRHDDRWFASASATFWLTKGLSLWLRYDGVISRSTSDLRRGAIDDRSYDKHLVTSGIGFAW